MIITKDGSDWILEPEEHDIDWIADDIASQYSPNQRYYLVNYDDEEETGMRFTVEFDIEDYKTEVAERLKEYEEEYSEYMQKVEDNSVVDDYEYAEWVAQRGDS